MSNSHAPFAPQRMRAGWLRQCPLASGEGRRRAVRRMRRLWSRRPCGPVAQRLVARHRGVFRIPGPCFPGTAWAVARVRALAMAVTVSASSWQGPLVSPDGDPDPRERGYVLPRPQAPLPVPPQDASGGAPRERGVRIIILFGRVSSEIGKISCGGQAPRQGAERRAARRATAFAAALVVGYLSGRAGNQMIERSTLLIWPVRASTSTSIHLP